ncbi:33688_t:CDS:2 [Racocetra persica]|uniref:33688_t:CDS:1 n=1 Tax=Racocetra persica TaxID=160502 RepID=A0ACA9S839_9GLOM|nr:33688_t:CDS:2 [Racocetra persica]
MRLMLINPVLALRLWRGSVVPPARKLCPATFSSGRKCFSLVMNQVFVVQELSGLAKSSAQLLA